MVSGFEQSRLAEFARVFGDQTLFAALFEVAREQIAVCIAADGLFNLKTYRVVVFGSRLFVVILLIQKF